MHEEIHEMYNRSKSNKDFEKMLIDSNFKPNYKRGRLIGFNDHMGRKFNLKRHFGIGIKEMEQLAVKQERLRIARIESRLQRLEQLEQKRTRNIKR